MVSITTAVVVAACVYLLLTTLAMLYLTYEGAKTGSGTDSAPEEEAT